MIYKSRYKQNEFDNVAVMIFICPCLQCVGTCVQQLHKQNSKDTSRNLSPCEPYMSTLDVCIVLMTNEMHHSYNRFLFCSFLSALHVSKESSRSSSGARHNILYYTVQQVQSCIQLLHSSQTRMHELITKRNRCNVTSLLPGFINKGNYFFSSSLHVSA